MKKFTAKLARTNEVARDTFSFEFDLQGHRFEFLPGQYVTVSLPEDLGLAEDDQARTFSIASTLEEPGLMVATRMTGSGVKKTLAGLNPGDPVQVEGPEGSFVFDVKPPTPVVFVAGGIGITPFRSMLKFTLKRQLTQRILLIYSNHTPQDAPFLGELQKWAGEQPNFRLLATMTQPEKSAAQWDGATGRIDATFLKENVEELAASEFYTAGPPKFVKGMKAALDEAGVPGNRLHAEAFPGYWSHCLMIPELSGSKPLAEILAEAQQARKYLRGIVRRLQ